MIRRVAYLAVAACLAAPAVAQTLPVFDETQGFDVVGVLDGGDALVVRNGSSSFACEVDQRRGFVALKECWPILGPKAAREADREAMSAEDREKLFLAALEKLPDAAFFPAIEMTLLDFDCTFDFSEGEELFLTALAANIASQMGHEAVLTGDAVKKIERLTDSAAEEMMKMGRIEVDRTTKTARLVGCE